MLVGGRLRAPNLLTVGEAALLLGVQVEAVMLWCDQGILISSSEGPRDSRIITEDSVLALIPPA